MAYETERVDISMRNIDRLKIIHEVLEGHLRQHQAATQLGISRRQVIRLCRRVQQEENRGIMHRLHFWGHSLEVQVSSGKKTSAHKPWLFGVDMSAVRDVHASGFSLKLVSISLL
jgi:hypothetical protein